MNEVTIGVLVGKTMASITGAVGGDEIIFTTTEGQRYRLYHEQDCCESVAIEDICGELNWLVGSPILVASEDSNRDNPPTDRRYVDSFTWTFYNIATGKGHVTIRWYGESNGYYSEAVDFEECA